MGMFDSMYDAEGNEWQTKAFGRSLKRWSVGDGLDSAPMDHQVEVYGGPFDGEWRASYATIRDRRVAAVPVERDRSLPLLDYNGFWEKKPKSMHEGTES